MGQGVNPLSITRLSPTQFQLSWYANTLIANDDRSAFVEDDAETPEDESIGFPINVFPTVDNPGPWKELHVNNNGSVTVGTAAGSYKPLPLQSSAQVISGLIALIASYWADVDTTPASNPDTANGCKEVTYGQGTSSQQ